MAYSIYPSREDKEYQQLKKKNELIGMATAFGSAICMLFCRLYQIPFLMIPGFVLWAISAGFIGLRIYKETKAGHKTYYVRVILMLIVAILMLFFITPIR